ncbi:hypothetical protein LXA43DRAFT_1058487 [Ganoderma leucocontextum]|nr:hypothetical protein LXA43DRAFT_1058487 [Ganoderma leucocontextum]
MSFLPNLFFSYHVAKSDLPHSFDEVSAVIRLAHKYNIGSIQDQALRALQEYHFTSDFAIVLGAPNCQISADPIHAIGAVNLARLTDTPLMLPLALYRCCYLDHSTLLHGWKRADGNIEYLAPMDRKCCSHARTKLILLHGLLLIRLLQQTPGSGSGSPDFRGYLPHPTERAVSMDVIWGWAKLLEELAKAHKLCDTCMTELLRRGRVGCKQIWDELPEIFGITVDGWTQPQASTG